MPPPRPIVSSYWATPLLLVCEYPGSTNPAHARQKVDALLAAGICDFCDLTQPGELLPYEGLLRERAAAAGLAPAAVRYRRFPIPDMGLPAPQVLESVLAALADSAAAGRKAAVHCWGGIGRTGTVVGCYLQRGHQLSGEQALARIAEEWQTIPKRQYYPTSPQTPAQLAFVRDFGRPAGL